MKISVLCFTALTVFSIVSPALGQNQGDDDNRATDASGMWCGQRAVCLRECQQLQSNSTSVEASGGVPLFTSYYTYADCLHQCDLMDASCSAWKMQDDPQWVALEKQIDDISDRSNRATDSWQSRINLYRARQQIQTPSYGTDDSHATGIDGFGH